MVKNPELNLEQMFNNEKNKELSFRFKVHICKQYIVSGQGIVLQINLFQTLIFTDFSNGVKNLKTKLVKSQDLIP